MTDISSSEKGAAGGENFIRMVLEVEAPPSIPSMPIPELKPLLDAFEDAVYKHYQETRTTDAKAYNTARSEILALFSSLSSELSRVKEENTRTAGDCSDAYEEIRRLREAALTQEDVGWLVAHFDSGAWSYVDAGHVANIRRAVLLLLPPGAK